MATFTYTKIADFILDQYFGFGLANQLKNSVRYLGEDVLGDPSTHSDGPSWLPAATKCLFYQAAAPTDWTRDTTAGLNDKFLRIVTAGSPGTTGGGVTAASGTLQFQTSEKTASGQLRHYDSGGTYWNAFGVSAYLGSVGVVQFCVSAAATETGYTKSAGTQSQYAYCDAMIASKDAY